mmetsp:Transcript_15233/g.48776  ORF Transcript_15233/g.48776 Transcript_15233/m.48776 type:complete len:105 (+) Transcript_15233:10-324(+)
MCTTRTIRWHISRLVAAKMQSDARKWIASNSEGWHFPGDFARSPVIKEEAFAQHHSKRMHHETPTIEAKTTGTEPCLAPDANDRNAILQSHGTDSSGHFPNVAQ